MKALPSLVALLLSCVLAATGAAQGRDGVLEGVLVDADGAPVPHAQVVLTESGRGTLSDLRGNFLLRGVSPGTHRLRVAVVGYAPLAREVRVGAGAEPVRLVLERTALSIPGVQVTATATGKDPQAVAQATTQLSGRELEREMSPTVAQMLRAQPGVAVRAMGPAATAPVLRGLSGDRVLVLQDGQRTADLSGSADDHGVTIDPMAAQRVEVVRGPATLLYGNNALGGVVNVISGDIPGAVTRPEWSFGAQTESAYPGGTLGVKGALPVAEGWAVAFRAGARRTGDMRIPNDPLLGDRLGNTDFRNRNAALGIGHSGGRAEGGAALRFYDFGYGLPVPPGSDPVELAGSRREGTGRVEISLPSPVFPSLRLEGTAQDYAHDELESLTGGVLQSFALDTRTAGVLARQGAVGPFSEGAWGVSALVKRYAATGPAALTPPADSRTVGVFGFEELSLGALAEGAALQLGGRLDRYAIESRDAPKFGPGVERVFHALSGSLGVRLPLREGVSAGLSLARSFRAPTVEELFSGAPHAGTGSIELGNPRLAEERGHALEVVLRAQRPRWTGQFAAWRNAIDGFIHLQARGDSLVGGVTLPVLEYAQARSTLQGFEGSAEWAATEALVLGVMGDYVHAEREDGTPLSFMPPPRLGGSVRWDDGRLSLGTDVHHEFRQDRVGAADERPTAAHTILRVSAGLRVQWGGVIHSVTLRGENLTDELHREATSRIKDFAPGPGRNLALVYRAYF